MERFHVITFGCQMNVHDSDRMAEVLATAGYQAVNSVDEADIVLLNTCSIRDKAEQKLRSEVGRLGMRKARGEAKTIVVAGCVAQQEGQRLLRHAPEIDLIIGPDNIPELPGLLTELRLGSPPMARTRFDLDEPRFLPIQLPSTGAAPSTFVTVMKGCDERCSYCIVPYTRGSERYRPSREIIDEIARVVAHGSREVTLLGQTVNSYTDPSGELMAEPVPEVWSHTPRKTHSEQPNVFPALLRAIAERVPQLQRLRYVSPHPRHLTRGCIEAHRDLSVLCRHLHMPVQSGSNAVLKRMIRRYTIEEYVERVTELQKAVPGLSISTDVIVGFPGETRGDFEATLQVVKQLQIAGLFAFKYSERPGTPSSRLKDDVTEEEKSARLEELLEANEVIRRKHFESLVGSTQTVLIEGKRPDGAWMGRTEHNEIVHLACAEPIQGRMLSVIIRQAFKNSLAGEAEDPALAQPITQLPRLHPQDSGAAETVSSALSDPAGGDRRVLRVLA